MSHPIFVYGTLHPDRAPAFIAPAVRLFRELGPATVPGRVYDLGEYPGIHLNVPHPQPIPGILFTLPEDPAILAQLDAYEGYDPDLPAGSLFLRQLTVATLPDGAPLTCWIYTYNGPLPDMAS
jgi:gamma-glutamylcyclotransferase (GGCT)/AIG2-like uncharacterized protein YtfP